MRGFLQHCEREAEVPLPQRRAQARAGGAPLRLVMIERADQTQHETGPGRRLGECVMKGAARVRPATEPLDASTRAGVARIGLVAVRLQQTAIIGAEQALELRVPA